MKRFGVTTLLLLLQILVGNAEPKFPVQVYYESLCPNCIEFFAKQLCPTWEKMADIFDIQPVPYGNARKHIDDTGKITISCQHGKAECMGNIMHACAYNLYARPNGLKFICCTMNFKKPTLAGSECAQQLNLPFDPIQKCMNSTQGLMYLKGYGDETDQLNPPHTFVPWTLFNGIYNAADMEAAQDHFKSVLCKYLEPNPPPQCNDIFD